jgi:tRNA(Ile)-lysidine synthase TilS/MesJ
MKRIEGKIRKACHHYDLISAGDRVAVGVSGGKDSVALLAGLVRLRRYYNHPFSLVALSLDPCFGNTPTDFAPITELCRQWGVDHVIKRTNLGEIIFDIRQEKNPCALCARMRRGALHDMCLAQHCNKIALGHHMDDVVETFFLNLFHEGRLAAFSPKTFLSRKNITMIRPLIFCTEQEVAGAMRAADLPVVKSACPMDGVSQRQRVKEFIAQKEREYPGFLHRTFTAMQQCDISHLGTP